VFGRKPPNDGPVRSKRDGTLTINC